MTLAQLQARLNTRYTDIFIEYTDTPTMRTLLILLYKYGYNFVNKPNFDTAKSCEELKTDIYTDFYKWYHGNSKPILHIFYNDINGKNELQFTTKSIVKTYPQYKTAKFHAIFG